MIKIEFNFEVHTNEQHDIVDKDSIEKLKKMMLCFETMVNTTLTKVRVNLKEK